MSDKTKAELVEQLSDLKAEIKKLKKQLKESEVSKATPVVKRAVYSKAM